MKIVALPIVLLHVMLIALPSYQVCMAAMKKNPVSLKVAMPAIVLAGDPIRIDVVLRNDSDQAVKCARPYSESKTIGLRLTLTRMQELTEKRTGEAALHRVLMDTLKPGAKWNIGVSLRRKFIFPENEKGHYELRISHSSTGASWKGKFSIIEPTGFQRTVAQIETPSLAAASTQKTKDMHKIILRKHLGRFELLYRNNLDCFEGNLKIASVAAETAVKNIVLEKRLSQLCCYGLDGQIRTVTRKERTATLGRKISKGMDYAEALKISLMKHEPKHVRAIMIFWVDEWKLKHFSVGKYLPLPILVDPPNDVPPELLGIHDRFCDYDIFCNAHEVSLEKPVKSILSVKMDNGHVNIICESREKGELIQAKINYKGKKITSVNN